MSVKIIPKHIEEAGRWAGELQSCQSLRKRQGENHLVSDGRLSVGIIVTVPGVWQ